METDEAFTSNIITNIDLIVNPITLGVVIGFISIFILLVASALISGAEVAFFSLSPLDLQKLKSAETKKSGPIEKLLAAPERLLSTILIANNFVNVGIVIISTYVTNTIFDFSQSPVLGFIFQVIVVTFLLLLFGEILPKVYASQYSRQFSAFMAQPLVLFEKLFRPLSTPLIRSTSFVNKRFQNRKKNISIDQLSDALDLTENALAEDKKMLQGIVKFGKTFVTEIMHSRMDIVAVDTNTSYDELLKLIIDSGFSRIPVYEESLDDIQGILYIKDLLAYLNTEEHVDWKSLTRKPYFIPETKKIDDLLEEFRVSKTHIALVVDEYGGITGLVTMEDILEEIVGEIKDESDEDESTYKKLEPNVFLFDGKTLINDFGKIVQVDDNIFDEIRGDAETLAGLILEMKGEIPAIGNIVSFKQFDFKIEAVDLRRIKSIRVTLKKVDSKTND